MVKSTVKNSASSVNKLKTLLPTIKNKTRKVQIMLRLKYEMKKQQKDDREKRKRERERTGQPVNYNLGSSTKDNRIYEGL